MTDASAQTIFQLEDYAAPHLSSALCKVQDSQSFLDISTISSKLLVHTIQIPDRFSSF